MTHSCHLQQMQYVHLLGLKSVHRRIALELNRWRPRHLSNMGVFDCRAHFLPFWTRRVCWSFGRLCMVSAWWRLIARLLLLRSSSCKEQYRSNQGQPYYRTNNDSRNRASA